MKLGNERVGLRETRPTGTTDEFGDQVVVDVDVEVPWSSMTPFMRFSENVETENRAAPTIHGMTWLAPPGTPVTARSRVVWPITGSTGAGPTLQLTGPVWEVIGDPAVWAESVETRLRKSS